MGSALDPHQGLVSIVPSPLRIAAFLASWILVGSAHADVVVKDTLDPTNFASITAGGGYIAQDPVSSSVVDGRTYIAYSPMREGLLKQLVIQFFSRSQLDGQPFNAPPRSGLFDLSVAQYQSLSEAQSDELRVDGFFPESTQLQSIFDNPVGQTIAEDGLGEAYVYQALYDLGELGIAVTPGHINYLGVSATGVPAGLDFQLQRSDGSGISIGSGTDLLRGFILPSGLSPMSDFFPDAIQNSVRITITNFDDARDGDFNQDGIVSAADYTVWRDNNGSTSGPGLIADGNVDGVVDSGDYDAWSQWFGGTVSGSTPSPALTVPEPATSWLIFLGAFFAAIGKRSSRR